VTPQLLLAANGAFQIIVSCVLGFVMLVPMQPWGKALAPRLNLRSMLAAHLDWIMLAFMQWGASYIMSTWPHSASMPCAWLLVFGGWTNPTPYLLRGFGLNAFVLAGSSKQRIAASIGGLSSLAILIAWVWLTARLLG
jgi:hypothetical protein